MLQFNELTISLHASTSCGVYTLYDGMGNVIYYGSSGCLRDRLLDHVRGYVGPCTQTASYFQTEQRWDYVERERQLLLSFKATYGRLPRCNELIP
jgi:excinuclease UvrABC nuclease subunit